jgi:hypothetical protein
MSFQNKIRYFVFAVLLGTSTSGWATSFFSSKGLGMHVEGINAAGLGMGASGIVLADPRTLSSLNPALAAPEKTTRLSIHFLSESIGQKNAAGTGHSNYNNAFGGQFLVPLGERYSFSMGISPLNYTDYYYESEGGSGENAHHSVISGKGSLNKLFLGFYVNYKNKIALGTSFNYALGKYDEKWRVNYVSSTYYNTADALHTKLSGVNWDFGIFANPIKNWSLGAVITTPLNLSSEHTMVFNYQVQISEYSYDNAQKKLTDGSLDIPLGWGIGSSYRLLDQRLTVLTEYATQPYSKLKLDDREQADNYNDYYRFSFGMSYKHSKNPFDKYLYHIPLRIGFYQKQLQMKYVNGNSVNERAVTFGFGLPFFMNFGRFDLGVALGKRGDLAKNPAEENFFNVMVSVTGGERWFIRGSRN